YGGGELRDVKVFLRFAFEVFLACRLARPRVREHEDPGFCPVAPGEPAAARVLDVPLPVELGGVLAEVPDAALRILRVVVAGSLLEPAMEVKAVGHDHA